MIDASYFGFSGIRAAVGPLFARSVGATQKEVNEFVRTQNLTEQVGFYNMLDSANRWGHTVVSWDDPKRGKVFKLIYNPDHFATKATEPPENWGDINMCKIHYESKISKWRRQPRTK